MTRGALALFVASGLTLSCGDDGMSPSTPPPAGTFELVSASPSAGGTVALPDGFFDFPTGNGWVQDLTVTVRFSYSQSIPDALVFIVLWRGSEQCVVAEGLTLGAPYGGGFSYVAGSTVVQSGNSFTGTGPCRGGAATGGGFTTDRLQFVLMDASRPPESRVVFTRDVALSWTFR
jgi:hypothetical protein